MRILRSARQWVISFNHASWVTHAGSPSSGSHSSFGARHCGPAIISWFQMPSGTYFVSWAAAGRVNVTAARPTITNQHRMSYRLSITFSSSELPVTPVFSVPVDWARSTVVALTCGRSRTPDALHSNQQYRRVPVLLGAVDTRQPQAPYQAPPRRANRQFLRWDSTATHRPPGRWRKTAGRKTAGSNLQSSSISSSRASQVCV